MYKMKYLIVFISYFILNVESCLFVLVGKKSKFAHDVGAACVFDEGNQVMAQYDSFATTDKSFGFNQNKYHVEYYKSDTFDFDYPNGTAVKSMETTKECSGANFDCFNMGSYDCQALCDIGYNTCIQWFNSDAQ
jgi:hypothetical protein